MKLIFGLTGKAGAGKDTLAKALAQCLSTPDKEAIITSFADPLKHYCMVKFGLTHDDVYTHEGKARMIPWLGVTVRELLQKEGTEHTKPFWGDDFWIRRMERVIASCDSDLIIPDVRFDLEAKWIRDQGGVVVEVHRDIEHIRERTHISEMGVFPDLVDFHFYHGTLEETRAKAKQLLEVICGRV